MRDIYVYEGTDVLINKLDIRSFSELKQIEADITSNSLANLIENPIIGSFDEAHFCQIHYRIFGELYEWAGQYRKVNIEKSEAVLQGLSVEYSDVFDIRKDLIRTLSKMHAESWNSSHKENVSLFCEYLTKIWKIHPFREGNTRTTMVFFYEYMEHLGIYLNTKLLSENSEYVRTAMVAASFKLQGVYEPTFSHLEKIVTEAMQK